MADLLSAPSSVVVVSNRGPYSFDTVDGVLTARRGSGGVAGSLAPLLERPGTSVVAAAMTEGDRAAAASGTTTVDGVGVRLLDIDRSVYDAAYNGIANSTLWFLHHGMFDHINQPVFDRRWHRNWQLFVEYNEQFAAAAAEAAAPNAVVLVQDYHLALMPAVLRKLRPDVRVVHFSHTPFMGPNSLGVLPEGVAHQLIEGMAAAQAVGFHTDRWRNSFEACARALGVEVPKAFVAPLGPIPADLARESSSPACNAAYDKLAKVIDGRQAIVRIERLEPTKNMVRGFLAFAELLEDQPHLANSVVFVSLAQVSRDTLPVYNEYRKHVEDTVTDINSRFGSPDRPVIELLLGDDYPRSLAALRLYDVLMVNPIRDGLNLVAKEGPIVNERNGVVALSREAGAWDELRDVVLSVNPFDVSGTAAVLGEALAMSGEQRAANVEALRAACTSSSPTTWLHQNLAAL